MADKTQNQTVEEKLINLYKLQVTDSKIDAIRILRGELPLQVKDLEDELAGLETRLTRIEEANKELKEQIAGKEIAIKESKALIERYEKQQDNVKNSREFDSLNKETEFQKLEIELSNKRIKEYKAKLAENKERIASVKQSILDKKEDLAAKQQELDNIVNETEKDEKALIKKSEKLEKLIDDRLLRAYKRIRANVKNKLAVVPVDRSSCGGCFNQIPPQRQLDVASRKKIIVCEHCGRILVDPAMQDEVK